MLQVGIFWILIGPAHSFIKNIASHQIVTFYTVEEMSLNKIYSDLAWLLFARVTCCECRKILHSSHDGFRHSDSEVSWGVSVLWPVGNLLVCSVVLGECGIKWSHVKWRRTCCSHGILMDTACPEIQTQTKCISSITFISVSHSITVTSSSSLALHHNVSVPHVLISLLLFSDRTVRFPPTPSQ